MALRDDNAPGKLWNFWQKTKALAQTPFQYQTARQAKTGAKNTGFTIGTAVAYGLANAHLLMFIPIPGVGLLAGCAASVACFYFGRKAYTNFKAVNQSSFVSGYVRDKKAKWAENKRKGNIVQRTLKAFKNPFASLGGKIPTPVVKAGKWLGYAFAAIGAAVATGAALSYAALPAFSTGATATTVLGGLAHAGALVGLTAAASVATVTGLAVVAIPLGIAAAFWCRKTAYGRETKNSLFGGTAKTPTPISQGEVFKPKAASFDFAPAAAPAAPASTAANDVELDAARLKAKEERDAKRAKAGRPNRF